MTADEWAAFEASGNPDPLIHHVWPTASLRKRRLFLIALHLRGGYEPADDWERHVLRVAEKAAAGRIGENHLKREWNEAFRAARTGSNGTTDLYRMFAVAHLVNPDLLPSVLHWQPSRCPHRYAAWAANRGRDEWERMAVDLVRCVFGDPTRPVRFDPAWKSDTAVALARGIDAGRAWDRLPILADALDDAGCDHPQVVAHCRADRTHAPGCWVVDAVLGKS